ncbi:MAG: polyphosphate kinase 2 [Gammaproteobacteria bacterium]|nr:MAG: polyphosphate kinase 2 [Gammaproteobacteria bacterium]
MAKNKHKKNKKSGKISNADYEKELYRLQVELVKMQEWVKKKGLRVIVIFEGRDAAGKGGVIKRIRERTSPRVFRIAALPTPTEREKTQLYMQRYISYFPAAGEVVLFDRSWYNRAGVERVMGFCSDEQYQRFLRNTPEMEHAILNDGIILIKYWFEVSKEVQTKRFEARVKDTRKQWKLSPMDLESHKRWYDYSRAKDAMFAATDTPHAPWFVVKADVKKHARLNCITHLLDQIPYQSVPFKAPKLPGRQNKKDYLAPAYDYHTVPEKF